MTRQESFKRRVRARMASTGERYNAARAALIAEATSRRRRWVSAPDVSDDAVRAATGRGWDDWCDLIDARSDDIDGHRAIAAHVQSLHGLDSWWAQSVTVGYERITGLRLPYQKADGSFTAARSKTVAIDVGALRAMLLDSNDRAELLPGHDSELRSRPSSKALRIAIGDGIAVISAATTAGGRTKVTVEHNGLSDVDAAEYWRHYWGEWLDAIDEP
jgi:hypothetical protein